MGRSFDSRREEDKEKRRKRSRSPEDRKSRRDKEERRDRDYDRDYSRDSDRDRKHRKKDREEDKEKDKEALEREKEKEKERQMREKERELKEREREKEERREREGNGKTEVDDKPNNQSEEALQAEKKAEEKRKRLEAWKKAQERLKHAEGNSNGKETKEPQQKPTPMEVDKKEPAAENDVDPLDAYMADIQQEVIHQDALFNKKHANTTKSKEEETYNEEEEEEEVAEAEDSDDDLGLKKLKQKTLELIDHTAIQYAPFKKNFYIEVPEMARMTKEDVAKLKAEMDNIKVRGKNCPKPIKTFTQCGLSDRILNVLTKHNYLKPTPIQSQAIPAIMCGRDIIGCAKTGSGKTLAFLLPMLRHIMDQEPLQYNDGPIGLIMVPTRELAMQIYSECKKFTKACGLRVVSVYGGTQVKEQIADLKRGAEIVVCTPGRMIDMLCANGGRVTNLMRVTFLVLDEADRMFDMGFEPQINRIISNIRPDRQTVMFSATFPRVVENAARKILTHQPMEIIVGGRSVVHSDITQIIEIIEENRKFGRLLELLGAWYEKGNVLVFVDTQEKCDKLFSDLLKAGYPCLSLHGGKDQQDRDFTIDDFKKKVKTILVATSVAARGLDVKDLVLVVNYDVPNHMEDYVHRCGRTGRAGNKGTAITFVTREEEIYS